MKRQRSATVSEGSTVNDKVLPTVFKWEGGGKQVYISGTFTNWKTLPMVKRYVNKLNLKNKKNLNDNKFFFQPWRFCYHNRFT